MAVIRTKPFFIIGPLEKRKNILEEIQSLSCAQIENIDNSKKSQTKDIIKNLKNMIKNSEASLEIFNNVKNNKKIYRSIKMQKSISTLTYCEKNIEQIYGKIKNIINFQAEYVKLNTEIKRIEKQIANLKIYYSIPVPIKKLETKNTTSFIGTLPKNITKEKIFYSFKDVKNDIFLKIHDENNFNINIFIISTKKAALQVEVILNKIDFKAATITSEKPPKEEIKILETKIKTLKQNIKNIKDNIKLYEKYYNDIKIFVDYLNIRKEKYETIEKLTKTKNTFILKGFLNPKYEKKLKSLVEEKFNSHIEILKISPDSPAFFSNNLFVSPVEQITKTYSMPCQTDIDPNPFMAFFYYMFFGMMFSDAGYGSILATACLILQKYKNITKEQKKKLNMFFLCGVATTFWGLLYGSFFGDIIEKIGEYFLNTNIKLYPLWISITEKPLLLLLFSLTFGVLQILIGLILKFYITIKQKNLKEACFNHLNWLFILFGIMLSIIGLIFKISSNTDNMIIYSKFFINFGPGLVIFGTTLTLIFSIFKNKGIMKFLGGLIELYGITSYISDILSYSRLMALGIATGVIANVVNILGTMIKGGLFGPIFFILITTIGHSLNFAINILGAYVHTNRLQYVEFFSKFYKGGGKAFKPFSMHTKYVEFVKNTK